MRIEKALWMSVALAGVLVASGCGREADKASRMDVQSTAMQTPDAGGGTAKASYSPRREKPETVRRFEDGKPVWASSRQRSAEESAQKQFDRNGADFAAASVDDYVAKAHAFLGALPKGVQTIARTNGDKLYYDPKANIFAVADKQGSPRTMFKPRDGMTYWTQQKARVDQPDTSRDSRRYRARSSGDDSNG